MPPKKIVSVVRVELQARQASPMDSGRALGTHGINLGQFMAAYNDRTAQQRGHIVPVDVTVYEDRSFTIATRTPATKSLLLRAAGLEKGAGTPNGAPIAWISRDRLREVAQVKLPDLNANDLAAAERIVAGTARSMGIGVRD